MTRSRTQSTSAERPQEARAERVEAVEEALTRLVRRARLPRTHQRLVERAGVSVDPALYTVLARVGEHGPVRLTELAHILGVDASTASRQLKLLERSGLVERRPDPDDGRAATFVLSTAGGRMLSRIREARHAAFSEVLGGWSGDDLDRLAELLDRLVDDIVRYTEDP